MPRHGFVEPLGRPLAQTPPEAAGQTSGQEPASSQAEASVHTPTHRLEGIGRIATGGELDVLVSSVSAIADSYDLRFVRHPFAFTCYLTGRQLLRDYQQYAAGVGGEHPDDRPDMERVMAYGEELLRACDASQVERGVLPTRQRGVVLRSEPGFAPSTRVGAARHITMQVRIAFRLAGTGRDPDGQVMALLDEHSFFWPSRNREDGALHIQLGHIRTLTAAKREQFAFFNDALASTPADIECGLGPLKVIRRERQQ